MVVTSILSVVSLVVMSAIAASNDFWQYGTATLDANARAARGLQRMVGELRNTMGVVPLSIYASTSQVQILGFHPLTDLDGDGTVYNAVTGVLEFDPTWEVRYTYDAATGILLRQSFRWDSPAHLWVVNDGTGTNDVVATGISSMRLRPQGLLTVDDDPAGWSCWLNDPVNGSCPAIGQLQVEVTSTQQVFDQGGFRPIAKTATTTLTLIHENVPSPIPLTYNVALTSPGTTQENFNVYNQFPGGSFLQ
ncbi:MAG: hypothetical protein HY597_01315 [Candidatus Omnitrophica bacterium]|nr:hypothetical protein [Candidatus Omnitrophota bacterium]